MRDEPGRVDEYLARLDDGQRAVLMRLRAAIRESAPDAIEGISYNMPAFYSGTRFLVSYAAFKSHLSLFPASGAVEQGLGDRLKGNLAGKGTIKFTIDQPLPDEVVREIVRIRLAEVAGEA